jgi:TRAP transporter TAXI family solute receptor
MKWLAGPQGGGWYGMAEALADLIRREAPGHDLQVVAGGGRENPISIQNGEGQIGMSVDFLVAAAYAGKAPYDQPPMTNVNTLGVGWSPLPFHLLKARAAREDFDRAIAGDGFRIAVPALNTSDELTFQRVLAFYESSYERIEDRGGFVFHANYDDLVAALKDGEVDYLFGATTKPAVIIAQAGCGPRPIELVPLPTDLVDHLTKAYGYGRGVIAAKTYPKLQSRAVATTFMETIFMIGADLPERLAYEVAKTLITHRDQLGAINASMADFNPKTAWRNPPAPIHPGALRAYREAGFAD